MTKLLIKLFIKDSENIENPQVREHYGRFAGLVGIITNIFLSAAKIISGFVFGSVAIMADGINNLSDATSSVVTLVGFRLAAMPGDDEHPFGHARYEYLSGLLVSVFVIVLGVQLSIQAFQKVLHPEPLEFSLISVAVLVFAIAIKLWQASFYFYISKKIDSSALAATGTDSRNDVISSAAILISIFVGKITGYQLDGIMGVAVGLFIIWSGIGLVREAAGTLLGRAPSRELGDKIVALVKSYDMVLGLHDLMVHEYGAGQLYGSVHVEVSCEENFMEAHDVADNIEREASSKLNMQLVVHLDPVNVSDEATNELRSQVHDIVNSMGKGFNMHDFRIVTGPTHTNIIFDVLCPRSFPKSDDELREILDAKVKELDKSYYTVITVDKSYLS